MLAKAVTVTLSVITGAIASPILPRGTPTDIDILQYALTLEHLENAFYSGALAKYDQTAFVKSGFPKFTRKRFVQVGEHEKAHVEFLTAALGAQATKPCEYNFPYHDPKSFAALSMILEGVGTSAYLGAAQFITDKSYLTAAGAVLTTEARHAAWVASAVNKGTPWSGPLDTPLDLKQVYSLAAGFITKCPSTNPDLGLTPFPALTTNQNYAPGRKISLNYNTAGTNDFLVLFSGLSTTYLPIKNGKATLPPRLTGTVYA
ncbi:hypothetical protein FRB90_005452, partial [Tulasnella sp. 427]